MKIEVGKIYDNKTLRYLVPGLNYYGETLKAKLKMVFTLGFGIYDSLLDGTHFEGQRNIFILIDKKVRPDLYSSFSAWIKLQEYFITDYVSDSPEGRKQMIVLAYPDELKYAYDNFLKGKYSKMYTKEQLNYYFASKKEALQVLQRTSTGKEAFKAKVKGLFDTILEEQDFLNTRFEYDLPPNKEEEIFNYNPN